MFFQKQDDGSWLEASTGAVMTDHEMLAALEVGTIIKVLATERAMVVGEDYHELLEAEDSR